jgi:hypothetical protein
LIEVDNPITVKRYFYILIFLLIGFSAMSQRIYLKNMTTFDEKLIHFGFTLGINATDFKIDHYPVLSDNPKFMPETINGVSLGGGEKIRADVASLTPGFTVGIVTSLRLTESFDLRFLPGMSFGERKLRYTIMNPDGKYIELPVVDVNNVDNTEYYSIKSTFLDFPLVVKYKAKRMNDQRPYVIAGAAYRIDISKTGQEDLVRLKPFSASLEAGVGWDTYLQFFRLSTEVKFSFGLDNILDSGPKSTQPQVYTDALSRVASNMFVLSFHFE